MESSAAVLLSILLSHFLKIFDLNDSWVLQVPRFTGRPVLQGLAVLCAVCMVSMIIMDRTTTSNIVSLSNGNSDPQLQVFSEALQKARLEQAKFDGSTQGLNQASNPMLKAADDLETAGPAYLLPIISFLLSSFTSLPYPHSLFPTCARELSPPHRPAPALAHTHARTIACARTHTSE
jgi:hypothetical protein